MANTVTSSKEQITALLQGVQKTDARLYEALKLIVGDLHNVITVVSPIQTNFVSQQNASTTPPADIVNFIYSFSQTSIVLAWSAANNATFYEIREGTVWATATFVTKTSTITANLNPRAAGTYNFLIKGINSGGIYSTNATLLVVTVGTLGSITVTSQIVDNNVLLSWNIPTSVFPIDHYNLYRNSVFYAQVTSNFTVIFELVAGTYTYSIEAVDIAGSVSAKGSVTSIVKQPPDYVLQSDIFSTFGGTCTNCIKIDNYLVACVDLTETFQAHFTNRGWASPQDQVNAGYDYFIQDNLLTGLYSEDIDYGAVLSNVIATITLVDETYSGTSNVPVTYGMQYKVNIGDSWSTEIMSSSQFFASIRYLRVNIYFTASNDDSMVKVTQLRITLNVKSEVDSGSVLALNTDPGGTVVTFNKAYKDINSLTATAASKTPLYVVTDFQDVPNPTTFKVMVFDSAGQRVTYQVDWKARGVV